MVKKEFIKKAATVFGLGNIHVAPGTFGTLGGIPIVLALAALENNLIYIIFAIIFFIFSVYISNEAERIYHKKDAQNIVIDEVMGYIITMFFVPINIVTIILGFILFRFFDITKIYPIRNFQRVEGGMGVVIDDVLAGVYACIVLHVIVFFMGM